MLNRRRTLQALSALSALAAAPMGAHAADADAEAARSLAPSGRLRAAINLGNGVLAQRDARTGELGGVSVFIAKALGERLNLPVDLVVFQSAGDVFDANEQGKWDLAFLGIEPERAARIDFTPPYVFIDGTYLVRADAPYRLVADVDREGVRISVGRAAAYDLFLSRNLKHAKLERAPTSGAAIELFFTAGLDAAAGVRQALVNAARGRTDVRVLQDRFTRIDQAAAVPQGRPAASAFVRRFLEELKASGKIRAALDATGQDGAVVAPAA